MENYMMYNGTRGVYTHTMRHERDENCIVCSAGVPLKAPAGVTLQGVIDLLMADPRFGGRLVAPSVSYQAEVNKRKGGGGLWRPRLVAPSVS